MPTYRPGDGTPIGEMLALQNDLHATIAADDVHVVTMLPGWPGPRTLVFTRDAQGEDVDPGDVAVMKGTPDHRELAHLLARVLGRREGD